MNMTSHHPENAIADEPILSTQDNVSPAMIGDDDTNAAARDAKGYLASGLPDKSFGIHYRNQDYSVFLQLYLCAAIVANLLLLFFDGNGGDIGFWEDWVKQLSTSGYHNFNGNYPPIYVHWLYLVGQIYDLVNMPIENNLYLKFLCQIPVLVCHLLLIGIIFFLVKNHAQDKLHFHAAMLLVTLNPAILFNGPIWGQIDVIPIIPVLLALLASFHPRWQIATIPLYSLALLTKFQMIAFAPVFGLIFFRHIRIHLIGAALSLVVIALAFLPSVVSGNFWSAFKLAYVDVLKQYGATTMGASNIWILLTGNAAPDSIVLFNIDAESPLAVIFTAKHFGIILFFLVCLWVFLQGMQKLIKGTHPTAIVAQMSEILFYALVCSAAFFTLLPAMHERYLLPAVIIALAYYAVTPNRAIYALAFTFVSAFNLAMTLGIRTSTVWPSISWIMLAAFMYCILELTLGRQWILYSKNILLKIAKIRYLAAWFMLLSISSVFYYLHQTTVIHAPELGPNRILLTSLTPVLAQQDFGKLQIHKNVSGKTLAAGGKRYAYGLGTHANSRIDYLLPANASEFSFLAGLDDSIESGDIHFSVWGDEKLMWESAQYGTEKTLPTVTIDLSGISKLSLRVSGVRGIDNDHANWINPIISIRKETD